MPTVNARVAFAHWLALLLTSGTSLQAQSCPELGPVKAYSGTNMIAFPCFFAGTEPGTQFTMIPAQAFPIEITKIGIGWKSQTGGQPPSIEDSIRIYDGAWTFPPVPPRYTLPAPVLVDGIVNEFDVAALWPGVAPVIVDSQTFIVTLRLAHTNNGQPNVPGPAHDGSCSGSLVNMILLTSNWGDTCLFGTNGDWIVYVKYRSGCAPGTAFCFGDGAFTDHTSPCACGNNGAAGRGCAHSFDANGAALSATGTIALDDVVLHSLFEPANAFTLFVQHDAPGDSVFHDGTLCAAGSLIRLRGRSAVGGEAFFPNSNFAQDSTTSLSQRGGVFPGQGVRRYYAAWFRNASTTFCPPATANVTNGWYVDW